MLCVLPCVLFHLHAQACERYEEFPPGHVLDSKTVLLACFQCQSCGTGIWFQEFVGLPGLAESILSWDLTLFSSVRGVVLNLCVLPGQEASILHTNLEPADSCAYTGHQPPDQTTQSSAEAQYGFHAHSVSLLAGHGAAYP